MSSDRQRWWPPKMQRASCWTWDRACPSYLATKGSNKMRRGSGAHLRSLPKVIDCPTPEASHDDRRLGEGRHPRWKVKARVTLPPTVDRFVGGARRRHHPRRGRGHCFHHRRAESYKWCLESPDAFPDRAGASLDVGTRFGSFDRPRRRGFRLRTSCGKAAGCSSEANKIIAQPRRIIRRARRSRSTGNDRPAAGYSVGGRAA